jgi:hypothetical protein
MKVKKIVLFVMGLIILSLITNANEGTKPLRMNSVKSSSGEKCFDENSHLLNIGIGFGGGNYYGYGLFGYTYRSTPAFSFTYEQAYPKKLGPGYLGVGAYLGYKGARSRYDNYYYNGSSYYYEHKWNYTIIAARAAYHWDGLNSKNAEVYGGAIIGFRVTTYKYSSSNNDPNSSFKRSDSGVSPVLSAFAGARWYFVPNFALFGELGYGISYATGGVTFKF